ncbi:hypothetical protein DERF_013349 [Dermatophagoides farinae]|uniref:Uncharacterized protein n=1 Tax=Dermatophagoides farinae TaxID=6954 RepID=A0A922KW96_DERFA|nr:hypothetical protein DERF_013349 [Dermatophagoides farinae]
MNANNKYLAINGSANDVGGNIFDISNKNTTNANKIEIPSVTFSPANYERQTMQKKQQQAK